MLTPAVPIDPAGRGTRIIRILQRESPGYTVLMELVVELEFQALWLRKLLYPTIVSQLTALLEMQLHQLQIRACAVSGF